MNFNDPTNYEVVPNEAGNLQVRRKPNRPHYKELFEDMNRSYKILFRCVIALAVALFLSLALNVLLITKMRP